MTVTLYDKSGESSVALGAATVPVGGDLQEGMVKLEVKGKDGKASEERVVSGNKVVDEAQVQEKG